MQTNMPLRVFDGVLLLPAWSVCDVPYTVDLIAYLLYLRGNSLHAKYMISRTEGYAVCQNVVP